MQISVRRLEKGPVIDISGDIDLANSPAVRRALLAELKERKEKRVMVNLGQVRYIDSSGIASLVEGLKVSRDQGARFILYSLSPATYEVLRLSRLLKIFEIYEGESQALEA